MEKYAHGTTSSKFVLVIDGHNTAESASVRTLDIHTFFIPNTQIATLIRDTIVHSELSKSNRSYSKLGKIGKPPIAISDATSFKRFLAILYLMDRPTKIRLFVEGDVCDGDLPLVAVLRSDGSCNEFDLQSRDKPGGRNVQFKGVLILEFSEVAK